MFDRVKQWMRLRALTTWLDRHERYLIPLALIVGVILDFVTFRSIQIHWSFLILAMYLVIAGTSIVLVNATNLKSHFLLWVQAFAPFVLQFVFGALLSASLVFYWFSGALSASWPIMIVVAVLMTSNEVLRQYYLRPLAQISVFFFAVFSVSTLFFPYLFHTIDAWVFLVSGLLSFIVTLFFTLALSHWNPVVAKDRSQITISMFVIALFMNGLYLFNIIPPIPLSLREAGVFHDVKRAGSGYLILDEQKTWMEQLFPVQTIHLGPNEKTFVFTSVFAPTNLSTKIVHHWQFYDADSRSWVEKSKLSFSLSGGRNEGYRGYSYKSGLQAGKWRVSVETPRGQVLARIRFNAVLVNEPASLIQITR